MSTISVLADYGDLCGEGPVWDPRNNQLYWTDCVGQKFYRYDWATKKHEVVKEGLEIYSCALNRPGGFVICNSAGFWLWDGSRDPHLLADQANGARCQINDSVADPAGRLLAGSYFYDPLKD